MDIKHLDDIVLAVLFASDEALNSTRICSVLDDVSPQEVRESLKRLESSFGAEDSVIRLEKVAGGHQLSTSPRFSEYVARLYRGRRKQRLSKAAMETLAIIAYKQPVTRSDIEVIRGVGCGGVVTTLMERTLIRIVGKAKVLGSPFLYGTTQEFLEYLGLNSLKDLPSLEDLEALLTEGAEAEATEESGDLLAGGEMQETELEDQDLDDEVAADDKPVDVEIDDDQVSGVDEGEVVPDEGEQEDQEPEGSDGAEDQEDQEELEEPDEPDAIEPDVAPIDGEEPEFESEHTEEAEPEETFDPVDEKRETARE